MGLTSLKHNIETIKQKIRDCDAGKCLLVEVLVEVNETEKELVKELQSMEPLTPEHILIQKLLGEI